MKRFVCVDIDVYVGPGSIVNWSGWVGAVEAEKKESGIILPAFPEKR